MKIIMIYTMKVQEKSSFDFRIFLATIGSIYGKLSPDLSSYNLKKNVRDNEGSSQLVHLQWLIVYIIIFKN